MISVFNCKRCLWKNLKIASASNELTCITNEYRFGVSLFPIVDLECDRVNRVLVLGGIDIKNPEEESNDFHFMQLDFTASAEFFRPLDENERLGLPEGFKILETWPAQPIDDSQESKKTNVKSTKKFKEDE